MKIEHDGFVLDVEEITDERTYSLSEPLARYKIKCDELSYFLPNGIYKANLETIITRFKLAVKSQIVGRPPSRKANEVEQEESKLTPKLSISFLTTNGKVITLPCHIRKDGAIVTEPFTQENTIVGWSLEK